MKVFEIFFNSKFYNLHFVSDSGPLASTFLFFIEHFERTGTGQINILEYVDD